MLTDCLLSFHGSCFVRGVLLLLLLLLHTATLNTATPDDTDLLLVPTPTRLSYIPEHPNKLFDYTDHYTCNPQSEVAYRMTFTREFQLQPGNPCWDKDSFLLNVTWRMRQHPCFVLCGNGFNPNRMSLVSSVLCTPISVCSQNTKTIVFRFSEKWRAAYRSLAHGRDETQVPVDGNTTDTI